MLDHPFYSISEPLLYDYVKIYTQNKESLVEEVFIESNVNLILCLVKSV